MEEAENDADDPSSEHCIGVVDTTTVDNPKKKTVGYVTEVIDGCGAFGCTKTTDGKGGDVVGYTIKVIDNGYGSR